ncbi:outer membrane beta-barrel protein [Pararhodonellum marinum]|uniref:outer membrane beta-barrel protein n=1 Tax=Pararhodonellum marinum TaxID=2755358 RepID=UPI001890AAED|nr:outer membrane beta-barrel protein [Pararhodonellum marinum]
MVNNFRIGLPFFFFLISASSNAQVLISLLFGDALNTDKIEFGLTGGMNRSYLRDIPDSEGLNNFNLGFYFNILLLENAYLSTGVLVKSNVGATGMATYPLGDEDFDGIFEDGMLTTKINYFYIPIMWQQRIRTRILLEGGLQAGLRTKAFDLFFVDSNGGELEFEKELGDNYHRLDAGVVGGVGYKLKKDLKSTSLGFLYYHGLVDVNAATSHKTRNSSLNIYLRIPIGAGEKKSKG